MDELLQLLAVPSETGHTELMFDYLLRLGHGMGWKMYSDAKKNLYAVKGEGTVETYPCAVAHTDTVHRVRKDHEIKPLIFNGNIIGFDPLDLDWTGIGGDDKCGIWAALHCLKVLPACKAVFFVDEERGCKGSGDCDMEFFKDCRYILQADRRGNADFVTDIDGRLSSDEFLTAVAPIIHSFGYKHSDGLMTDVRQLRDKDVGISVANMSAGYYRPHSDREYINIYDLEQVCLMMQTIFEQVTDTFPFKYEKKVWKPAQGWVSSYDKKKAKGNSDDQSAFEGDGFNGLARCDYCATLNLIRELIEGNDGTGPFVCLDCALVKEETGSYPVVDKTKGFWHSLTMGSLSRKKRRKMKKWGRKNTNGANGNGETVIVHGTAQTPIVVPKSPDLSPPIAATLREAADKVATAVNNEDPYPF